MVNRANSKWFEFSLSTVSSSNQMGSGEAIVEEMRCTFKLLNIKTSTIVQLYYENIKTYENTIVFL